MPLFPVVFRARSGLGSSRAQEHGFACGDALVEPRSVPQDTKIAIVVTMEAFGVQKGPLEVRVKAKDAFSLGEATIQFSQGEPPAITAEDVEQLPFLPNGQAVPAATALFMLERAQQPPPQQQPQLNWMVSRLTASHSPWPQGLNSASGLKLRLHQTPGSPSAPAPSRFATAGASLRPCTIKQSELTRASLSRTPSPGATRIRL